jgi:3-phosphoshikimate 1-carboxyvinyltransferase
MTRYRESILTRDHTERLLGIALDYVDWITVDPEKVALSGEQLSGPIAADPSTASFWISATLMISDSEIELPGLLANPLRVAHLKLLADHGASIFFLNKHRQDGEEGGNLKVNTSPVAPFIVQQPVTASVIDEIPALAILATQLQGRSEFHDLGELRVKESNRLQLITGNLRRMGAQIDEWQDGFAVKGQN